MRRLFRAPAVQRALAGAVAAYMEAVIATLRWRCENIEAVSAALASPKGAMVLFWHGRIAQAIACRPFLEGRARRAMISHSRDGAFIALAAERLGFPAIRGSSGRAGRVLAKGGADAFRRALDALAAGEIVLVTPDGPRGPALSVPRGPALLAHLAGCPVYLLGLAARPALAMGNWDAARVPLPFSRAALVIDGPVAPPPGDDEASLEAARTDWRGRMIAAGARAESLARA
ncbi:MAG: DUF374 domain-containing protein [Caulobacteraceae bacterium]